jgi:hypothetical protein
MRVGQYRSLNPLKRAEASPLVWALTVAEEQDE